MLLQKCTHLLSTTIPKDIHLNKYLKTNIMIKEETTLLSNNLMQILKLIKKISISEAYENNCVKCEVTYS